MGNCDYCDSRPATRELPCRCGATVLLTCDACYSEAYPWARCEECDDCEEE